MTNRNTPNSKLVAHAASIDKPTDEDTNLPDLGEDLGESKLRFEVNSLQQQLKEQADTHDLRIDYVNKIFWLIRIWLICVIITLILTGFKIYSFYLSDKVLITFITSTTISVLGLFVIVAKWMFPQSGKTPQKNSK